jgi:hypothetical protein
VLLLNDDLTGSGVITWFYRVGGAGLRRRRVGSRQHHSRFLQTNGAALRRNHNRHPYLAFRLGHFGVRWRNRTVAVGRISAVALALLGLSLLLTFSAHR